MCDKIPRAAYLPTGKAYPLEISSAPRKPLEPNAIRICVHALAINPVDHILQTHGTSLGFPHLKYPLVLGSDVAGTIIELGTSVSTFTVGDRILGQCLGTDKSHTATQNAEAGFQDHCILQSHMCSKIPSALSFERACVLPLALSTASCGLFQVNYLKMHFPTSASSKPEPRNETVLIWGGSTSVGTNAIQLSVASGYEVVTTCSPRNSEYCRSLGASSCFDYTSPSVIQDITSALNGKICVGALAIGANSALPCIQILAEHHHPLSTTTTQPRKFVAIVSGPDLVPPTERFATIRTISRFLWFGMSLFFQSWRYGVQWKFVMGTDPAGNEIGPAIYNDFLPDALESGRFRALPEARVVGMGLEKVQEAMDLLRKGGVSTTKIVVRLI